MKKTLYKIKPEFTEKANFGLFEIKSKEARTWRKQVIVNEYFYCGQFFKINGKHIERGIVDRIHQNLLDLENPIEVEFDAILYP